MNWFNFKKEKTEQVTVEQIKDFYRYSEVAKWAGQSSGTGLFGISIESTRENSETVYNGIMLYNPRQWAHVSIENGSIKYQYTENGDLRSMGDCPVTANPKEISLIANNLLELYRKLKLPDSIEEVRKRLNEKKSISVVREITINAFGDKAVLRVLSDKTTFLIFNMFPPKGKKFKKYQIDNFEKLLADTIEKKVIHDDRELFVIFDDSQKMIDGVISFLQRFQ